MISLSAALRVTRGVRVDLQLDQFTTTSTSTSHLPHDRPASVIKSHARRSDEASKLVAPQSGQYRTN